MGKVDTETRNYLNDSDRFADAFIFFLYDGEYVIKPNFLHPLNTAEIVVPYGGGAKVAIHKERDLLKIFAAMYDDKAAYCILGIESQTHIHYAMPVRSMLYDALNYTNQVCEAEKSYCKAKKKLSREEFLSGFCRNDKLMPVITLTLCLSDMPWDAPTSMHEMMATKDEHLLKFVPNYTINLLSPAKIEEKDFDKFRSGLGSLLQFIRHRKDLDRSWMAGKKMFKEIDWETAHLIKTLTGAKFPFKQKEGVVNMWEGWEMSIKQARDDGYDNGYDNGYDSGYDNAKFEYLQNLMETTGWDPSQAMKALRIPEHDQDVYIKHFAERTKQTPSGKGC